MLLTCFEIFHLYINCCNCPKKTRSCMYQFWYSLLKYCCTHKYCKIWDNKHKRGIKHTKMVIVGVLMWGRRRWPSLILTGVSVMKWKIVIWALTLCRPSRGLVCASEGVWVCVCVFWGFSKAPHSPNMFSPVHFTKTEEVEHELTQPVPCRFVASEYRPSTYMTTSCSQDTVHAFHPHLSHMWQCGSYMWPCWSSVLCWYAFAKSFWDTTKAEELRTVIWQSLDWSLYPSEAGLHWNESIWFKLSTEYELCLRATWNPSQQDVHNAINFQKTSIWRRPTHSHYSSSVWLDRGRPMTAKHIQSLGPSSCLSSWEKSKPFEWVQQPAATLSPARLYIMYIFKSQTKRKNKTCWCPDPILSLALHPFPFPKTPAGIGPQNNKELNWGNKWIGLPFPIMHPCTISEQREKPARKITKKHHCFSNVEGPRPPEVGSEVWDKSRKKRGE